MFFLEIPNKNQWHGSVKEPYNKDIIYSPHDMNMPIISSGNGNTLLLNAKGSTFPPPQEKRMGGIRKGKSL